MAVVRKQALARQIEKEVKKSISNIDLGDLEGLIQNMYHNFKISTYKPLQRVLPQKTEERLRFDNVIRVIYQGQPILLTYRIAYTAGQKAEIRFRHTTREDRRIIEYFELRPKLQNIYENYINNNIDFWELFAKIYIK